jgi:hypothetical protein
MDHYLGRRYSVLNKTTQSRAAQKGTVSTNKVVGFWEKTAPLPNDAAEYPTHPTGPSHCTHSSYCEILTTAIHHQGNIHALTQHTTMAAHLNSVTLDLSRPTLFLTIALISASVYT